MITLSDILETLYLAAGKSYIPGDTEKLIEKPPETPCKATGAILAANWTEDTIEPPEGLDGVTEKSKYTQIQHPPIITDDPDALYEADYGR